MSQVIELLEEKLIPLEKQLVDTRKPFSDKINNNYFKPYGITNNDVNAYTKAVCAKKIKYGQRTTYGCDGGEYWSIHNSAKENIARINAEQKLATAGLENQIKSVKKEIEKQKELAQLPLLRKNIIDDNDKLRELEAKYDLYVTAQRAQDASLPKEEVEKAQAELIGKEPEPQKKTNIKQIALIGGIGLFLSILIIILAVRRN
jgi:hypothetical protein